MADNTRNTFVINNIRDSKILAWTQNCGTGDGIRNPLKNINNCKEPIESFTGRGRELLELEDLFSKHNTVVICGVGGVGKTQLAKKYAFNNKDKYKFLFWIQAETPVILTKMLYELAVELDIEVKKGGIDRNLDQTLKEICEVLKKERSLLIFDNAVNDREINKYLPSGTDIKNTTLHVLLTSQYLNWNKKNIGQLELAPLEKSSALMLLEKILNNGFCSTIAEDKEELVNVLEYMPLSIQVAASFINIQMKHNNTYTISRYVEKLRNETDNIHTYEYLDEYGKSLCMSIKISLDVIRKQKRLAMEVINVMSFLNPDVIEKYELERIMEISDNDAEDEFNEAFELILNYSIVSPSLSNYYMHRIIQKIIRHNLSETETSDIFYNRTLTYFLSHTFIDSIHLTYVFKFAKDHGASILHYFRNNNLNVLLILLCKYGCYRNLKEIFESTKRNTVTYLIVLNGLLQMAVYSENMDVVKMICKYELDINFGMGQLMITPLHMACVCGCEDMVVFLLEKGADAAIKTVHGRSSLHYACISLNLKIVSLLLKNPGIQVNDVDNENNTPLSFALDSYSKPGKLDEFLKIAHLLIDKGSDTKCKECVTVLHLAALGADHEFVGHLLDKHTLGVNETDKNGCSPLCTALFASKSVPEASVLQTVKLLIAKGSHVHVSCNMRNGLLHYAAQFGHYHIIQYLIQQYNLDVNKTNTSGETPLFYALMASKSVPEDDILKTVKLLKKKEANIDATNQEGEGLLHYAVKFCHHHIIPHLVEQYKLSVNMEDSFGRRPLFYSLLANKSIPEEDVLETVKTLITQRANVEATDYNGNGFLHYAALIGCHHIIQYITEQHNLLLYSEDSCGCTPLFYTLFATKSVPEDDVLKTMKLMLEKGALVDVSDRNGNSLLHHAAAKSFRRIIEYLIQHYNVSVNKTNLLGQNVLCYAIANNESMSKEDTMSMVSFLLVKGAKVETTDKNGFGLLHYAAEFGHHYIIRYLVEKYNLDVNTLDSFGRSPLCHAVMASKSVPEVDIMETVKLLIAKGANVQVVDKNGVGLLNWATYFGHHHIAQYLQQHYNLTVSMDSRGLIVLFYAMFADKQISEDDMLETVKLMVAAYTNATDNNGSFLHYAARYGCHDMLSYLIKNLKLPVNATDLKGRTPVFYTCYSDNSIPEDDVTKSVQVLISNGAIVDITVTYNNCTLLHFSAEYSRYEILAYLLKNHDINIDSIDFDGDTPLHCALQLARSTDNVNIMRIVEILLFKGTSINIRNNEGQTALDLAAPEIKVLILKSRAVALKADIPTVTEFQAIWRTINLTSNSNIPDIYQAQRPSFLRHSTQTSPISIYSSSRNYKLKTIQKPSDLK